MPKNKICSKCKLEKSITCFYKSKYQAGGYQAYCRGCNLANLNKIYPVLNIHERRKKSRQYMLKSKYGITPKEYNELLNSQGGVCAICKRHETSISNKKGGVDHLRVDHCHETTRIRGLLCSECNFGISKFDDKLSFLLSAVAYLLEHKQIMHEEGRK